MVHGGAGLAVLIGVAGLGIAWFQWYNSDTLALKAMRAREVTPEEAPELHGMIDRLCALADMPKPRVAIAYTDMPNAFATGRSPQPLGGLRHHRHPATRSTAEELEGVLAHELSHVAHRDVLVMTLAASAGIIAGMLIRGAQYGAIFGGGDRRDNNDNNGVPVWLIVLVVSLVVYAVSFFLTRLLSRYRELCADRAGAFLTEKPSALASALTKISGEIASIPQQGPARGPVDERLLHHPGDQRDDVPDAHLDPPVASSSGSSSWPRSPPSSASRWTAASAPGLGR